MGWIVDLDRTKGHDPLGRPSLPEVLGPLCHCFRIYDANGMTLYEGRSDRVDKEPMYQLGGSYIAFFITPPLREGQDRKSVRARWTEI